MKKIYIAPIAGVTDYTFRGILEDFKPDLIFTEMVSVNALSVLNDKTISKILKLRDGNAVQNKIKCTVYTKFRSETYQLKLWLPYEKNSKLWLWSSTG